MWVEFDIDSKAVKGGKISMNPYTLAERVGGFVVSGNPQERNSEKK